MQSFRTKKVLKAVGLLICVIFFLSACQRNGQSYDKSDRKKSSEEIKIQNGGSEENKVHKLGRYEDEIEMSFIRGIDDDMAENVLPNTPNETIEDNRWLDLYREELGIKVSYDWIVKGNEFSDAFVQKLNVTMASGELPDVILVNASQLKQLADLDMIVDMTPYFEEYASDLTKEVYHQEGDGLLDSATFDGKLMAIPDMVSMVETAQYLWIRKDWLEKLGLEPPQNMEDLLRISEAFSTMDPDGDGIDNTLGLPITKYLYSGAMGLEGFFAGFGAYPNMWIENENGGLVYGSLLPEVKETLVQLAEMYRSGQIDKEFAIKDGGKVAESIIAGKFGLEYGEQWNPMHPLINNYYNDPEADWTGYPIVAKGNEKCMVPLISTSARYAAVRKNYEHPEALIKMINLYLEKNWGETNDFNQYYMPVENGGVGVWKFSPVTPFPPYKNFEAFMALEKARQNKDFSQLEGEPKVIQGNIEAYGNGDQSQWGWEKIYGEEGVFRVLKMYMDNDQLLRDKFVGAPTPTMVEKESILWRIEVETFTKIIMGEYPIDAFDGFVENWYKLGGKDITNEVNEWYDSIK